MKNEEPRTREEMEDDIKHLSIRAAESLCTSEPFWNAKSCVHVYSDWTDRLRSYYLVKKRDGCGYGHYTDIRWDRIHGKKRKILKYKIKQMKREVQAQYDAWNRYTGQEDVLYIHSRMGGGNWKYYEDKDSIIKQPWFLERVDDCWDNTYCDFYAKVMV